MSPLKGFMCPPRYLPLPSRERSVLIVIDVQESLVRAMEKEIIDGVIGKIALLIKAAKRLGVPIIWTEQYPKGLKETVEPLKTLLKEAGAKYIEKTEFSCMLSKPFVEAIERFYENGRRAYIITGIETHVCILQTAMDMMIENWEAGRTGETTFVYIPSDATCSRRKAEKEIAERFMSENGVGILSTEAIIFSWLERADTREFKEFLQLLKQ